MQDRVIHSMDSSIASSIHAYQLWIWI